ncbi:MAG: DUF58 domain-containing protein [Halobacteriales archaeon]|nr:DUF58 domain-containing protein [Halobacteriales archaeon]
MLTRAGSALLHCALALLVLGLTLGNYYLVLAAALPLFVWLGALGVPEPGPVAVERSLSPGRLHVGELLRVEVRVRARRGLGLLEVQCPVPEVFELVDGSNLHLLRKGLGALDASFAFTVRCTKRGSWDLEPVRVESVHGLGVRAPVRLTAGEAARFEVLPRLMGIGRIRAPPGHARLLFPEADHARTGVRTNEFLEIREYAWGDPVTSINWKATARQRSTEHFAAPPLVNEYEREGKKSVWLFVDAAPYMEVGSTAENVFERAVEAAGSVAKFYLDRGYRVGCYVYNGQDQLVHPDTGGRQFLRIRQVLTDLTPGQPGQGLRAAVERCRGFLIQGRPLVIVVTRLGADQAALTDGIRRLRVLTGGLRRRLPVIVLSPHARHAPSGTDYQVDALLRPLNRPHALQVRGMGAALIEWDPHRVNLATALLRGVR